MAVIISDARTVPGFMGYQNKYSISSNINISTSHMSGALDGTEKNSNQKLDHPMLVQPILSQKNQKSKFFNEPFFCN